MTVLLRGDGDLDWQPVSPRLRTVRTTVLLAVLALPVAGAVTLAVLVTSWAWVAVGVLAAVGAWGLWLIARQVPAISWVELPEELVVRKGRLVRTMSVVPYGRLQFVDLSSGPLLRRHGLASIELHTASPHSGGDIPGLPTDVAEALRERLSARGESFRAGL